MERHGIGVSPDVFDLHCWPNLSSERAMSMGQPRDTSETVKPAGRSKRRQYHPPSSFRGVRSTSYDVQLHIRESITTIVRMVSGPAPSGASSGAQLRTGE